MTIEVDAVVEEPPSRRLPLPEGVRIARQLLAGVGDYQMRRAIILLGHCQDGYWLCRFSRDSALAGILEPAEHPASMDWDQIVELLRTPEVLKDDHLEPGALDPRLALLEIAASLGTGRPVDLRRAACVLPASEWRDLLGRIEPAADFA
ncbi:MULTISPECIES: hypothetical protein [unclassified Streptomyces]|uniref:hypothetical protein n=1 Tax=unclassified Streptomyces TaxID=2593676 RepID=UPI00093E8C2A|nr:hypothetical protein [Streptomyces sp. TSRI0281]OKI43889.1 hypothetical protein A6A29_35320 [Streptomyces sp. TSRI0281]